MQRITRQREGSVDSSVTRWFAVPEINHEWVSIRHEVVTYLERHCTEHDGDERRRRANALEWCWSATATTTTTTTKDSAEEAERVLQSTPAKNDSAVLAAAAAAAADGARPVRLPRAPGPRKPPRGRLTARASFAVPAPLPLRPTPFPVARNVLLGWRECAVTKSIAYRGSSRCRGGIRAAA